MADPSNATARAATERRQWLIRQARLGSGLVLMAFATTHFVNHAFGLVSPEAAERASALGLGLWHDFPGWVLLSLAFLVHGGTALHAIWARRSLRMPAWQATQAVLGLAVPFLLALHYMGSRGIALGLDTHVNYAWEFHIIWPGSATQQFILLLVVWLHGCLGIHYWLRLRRGYRRVQGPLLALAVLVPTLAIAGVISAGRAVRARAAADPAWLDGLATTGRWPASPPDFAFIYSGERWITLVSLGLLLLVLGGRLLRRWLRERRENVRIVYDDGRTVRVPRGLSVLEASRMAGIPHASVCGGRGRCSTCRVRVGEGAEHLPPRGELEEQVLSRLGVNEKTRLACQLRPVRDIAVTRLIPAGTRTGAILRRLDPAQGSERVIAVLFADLRGFTKMADGRLPFDVVFVLNQYFAAMGRAIEGAGGHVDKFIGDGIMALFGLEETPEEAARRALAAARAMGLALHELNEHLAAELPQPMRMGIGLHLGHAIVGELGYGAARTLTAIGDTVNIASRLEGSSKELGVQLVVSDELLACAGITLDNAEAREIELRGRRAPLAVHAIADAATLAPVSAPPPARRGLRWRRRKAAGG